MDLSALKEIGLTDIEAQVYYTLLMQHGGNAGQIIKKTNLHKATVYNVLLKLIEKGIVSYVIIDKERHYKAEDPNVFLDILKYKEDKIKNIIPNLESVMGTENSEQEVNVFVGTIGVKTVLENILKELRHSGTYYDFGVSGLFKEIMGAYWYQWQIKKKLQNINSYCIFTQDVNKNKELIKNYVGKKRFIPVEYNSFVDTIIYNDKVILFIWNGKPPIAIKIKSKDVAEAYKNQFMFLWHIAKK